MSIWELAAIPGDLLLLSCAAWAFVCPGAWLLRQPAKRRAGGQPAPGAGKTPVPGKAVSTARPPLSPLRPPPPAPGHRTGRITFTIRTWECGCMLQYDREGRITWAYACTEPDLGQDPDEWLKGLTR